MFDNFFDKLEDWYQDHKSQVDYVLVWLLRFIVLVGAYAALLVCLAGCKPQQVMVTKTHESARHDTLLIVDSIFQDRVRTEFLRGDTLIIRDSVYIDRVRYSTKSVEVVVRDSVPYLVEVVKEVPRKRNSYDRFCSVFFWCVLMIAVAAVVVWATNKRWGWFALIRRIFAR